jgi:hypothetical protein
MLLLADHGLTVAEQMRVHNRILKYADWRTARQIFERGTDMAEMKEMLINTRLKTRKHCKHDFSVQENRYSQVSKLEETSMAPGRQHQARCKDSHVVPDVSV